jgi:hypothetical protein
MRTPRGSWLTVWPLPFLASPTKVVVKASLTIAKIAHHRYLRFVRPLLVGLFFVTAAIVVIASFPQWSFQTTG